MRDRSVTQLRLNLLGPPKLTHADGTPLALRSRKHLALLIYLATEPPQSHSRDTLLALLWPEATEAAARNNLRVALADLRNALGDEGGTLLQTSRRTVQLAPASDHGLDVDVSALRALLASVQAHDHVAAERCAACLTRLEQAATLYRGAFLHGFNLPDSAAFEEWVALQREQLHLQQLATLETLAAAHQQRGDLAGQVAYGRRLLALEPWLEAAHDLVIRGLWSLGERAAALEQYEACRRILAAELGLEPSPELAALAARLRQPSPAAEPAVTTRPAALAHTLPAPLTPLLGRERELKQLQALLAQPHARLVTLAGPGGIGKTSLALRLAHEIAGRYADGTRMVQLAPLSDGALVPQAVAEALDLREHAGRSLPQVLTAALRDRQLLLLLDNCEHLAQACRLLAVQLLEGCPQLSILATSREVLAVAGERVWHVPPLRVPDATAAADALPSFESVRLFVERAGAASSSFRWSTGDGSAIAQICRRLDGIPLAIELAAAQMRHLSVAEIAARLDDRFALLRNSNEATPRRRTLRATIDWSYNLLSEDEQTLFRRLAVFAGGWTLESAEAVCACEGGTGRPTLLELLAQLVDKSLVVAEQRGPSTRYRLLETVRAYAHERLAETGELEATRGRHLAHFAQLAHQAEPHLSTGEQVAWFDRFAVEHDNLRAAFDHAVARADVSTAMGMVSPLRSFWYTRGHYEEGRRRILDLLAMPAAQVRTATRVNALNGAAALLWMGNDAELALPLLDEALALARELADPLNIGWALLHQGTIAYRLGDSATARPLLEEGLASCRAVDPEGRRGVAWGQIFLGNVARDAGETERARTYFVESVELLRAVSDYGLLAYPLRQLAHIALAEGDLAAARALNTESLRLNQAIDDRLAVVACLVVHAALAAAEGESADGPRRLQHLQHAANLCGMIAARLEVFADPLWPADTTMLERIVGAVQAGLGEAAFVEAVEAGRGLTLDEALAGAPLAAPVPVSAERLPPGATLPAALTPLVGRERELAELSTLLLQPEVRILTLVGVGGMGKTRLAQELGRASLTAFADGVAYVSLASLADPAAIPTAILAALDEHPGSDPRQVLLTSLRPRRLLLILDNFEHLLDGAALVTEIAEAAPQLTILVTSRERLNLRGEHQYILGGLAVGAGAATDAAPALRLFVERARRVRPGFAVDIANRAAILRICRLVDGMPLGIELAATWIETLAPAEIAAEIGQNLDFLTAEWRDLPERQRSMRAVFDWSWQHLSAAEQQVFARLAVFCGGFSRQAAQVVAGASLPVLTRLLHKSLIQPGDTPGRYALHELLRQFADEHLQRTPEAAATRERHLAFFLELAERGDPEAPRDKHEPWLAELARDHDNIRAALTFCLQAQPAGEPGSDGADSGQGSRAFPQVERGLRLAGAVWPFWQRHCYLSEGRSWIERLLAKAPGETVAPLVRANALYGAGWLAHDQDDYPSADDFFSAGLALEQALGKDDRVSQVLAHRGIMARGQGQYAEAITLVEESLTLARAAGSLTGIAYALFRLGVITRERGQFARAAASYDECLRAYRTLGDRRGEAFCLLGFADIARDQGDPVPLHKYSAEALALGQAIEQPWVMGFALNNLALAAMMERDLERAAELGEEALTLFQVHDIRGGVVEVLVTTGQIAAAAGSSERAWARLAEGVRRGWPVGPHWLVATGLEELARQLGPLPDAVRIYAAAKTWRNAMGIGMPAYRQPAYEAALMAARHALGEGQFAALWAEGAGWPPERAVALALELKRVP